MYHGLSKPNSLVKLAIESAVALCPRITWAGFPGMAWMMANTTRVIPNNTGTNESTRRTE